jgi:hypothetical protein
MDAITIVYVSAIIFPLVVTAGLMIFTWHSMKKNDDQKELNDILEDVIESQDKNLDLYRSTLKDYRETFGKI